MSTGFQLDTIKFSPDTLLQFPEHAALLGEIVTSFSLIEGVIGGIYGMLRHQSIEKAIEELKKLSTNAKRVEAVRAEMAKDTVLSANPSADQLMKTILKYAEKRNKIAHGIWGYDNGRLGVVYLLPVKKWINFVASLVAIGTAGTSDEQIDQLKSHLEEYDLPALQALKSEGTAMLDAAMKLFLALCRNAAKSDGWIEE